MTGRLRERIERLVGFVRRRGHDHDVDEELEAHLDLAADEYVRRGMTPEEARRRASVALGSRLVAREQAGDQRSLPWMESWTADLRYAVRMMRKTPGFTATAVAMLAAGIGLNVIVFTVTNAVLFKGFPGVRDNDRLLYITALRSGGASYPDFEDWRAQAQSFQGMALVRGGRQTYSDGSSGFPETFDATAVTADTFRLVGQRPILGRDFASADEAAGAAPVVILRHGFWERRYGKDPSVVGRVVQVSGLPTTVIGVMPPGFSFPQNQDLWVPLVPTPDVRRRENHNNWFVLGRLNDGVTMESARAELAAIGERLEIAHPLSNKGFPVVGYRFHEFFIGPNATLIYQAMVGAVGFVLLIACANLANLLLARAMTRSHEVAVRLALGAARSRVVRQLLIESVMISSLGGFAGFWIAKWGVRVFALFATGAGLSDQIAGNWFDHIVDYSMDYRVFAFVVAVSIGTGLLFGLAPARRLSTLDVNAALKDGGRGSSEGRGKRLSALLVVSEMALAIVLLAGAGVMIRSFLKIYTADIGFNRDGVLTALVNLPTAKYPNPAAQIAFFDRLEAQVDAIPGVDSAAVGSLPASGSQRIPYEIANAPPVEARRLPTLSALTVGPSYFHTLGVPVITGREFNDIDRSSGIPVVLVNQRFASAHWPNETALGKRLRLVRGSGPGPWLSVVGVVGTIAQNDPLQPESNAAVYLPYQQQGRSSMWVIARTRLSAGSFATSLRTEVQALDSILPLQIAPFSLADRLAERYQYRAVSGILFLVCAIAALLLASIGLYAVVAHSVSQRTKEIGVRIALGGTASDILRLVIRQGMMTIVIGLSIGLAAALVLLPALEAVLVQVSPADPLTLAFASGVLSAAALLGCLIPARRAMRVEPLRALRTE
jgi:putative ABC transport system permease protein